MLNLSEQFRDRLTATPAASLLRSRAQITHLGANPGQPNANHLKCLTGEIAAFEEYPLDISTGRAQEGADRFQACPQFVTDDGAALPQFLECAAEAQAKERKGLLAARPHPQARSLDTARAGARLRRARAAADPEAAPLEGRAAADRRRGARPAEAAQAGQAAGPEAGPDHVAREEVDQQARGAQDHRGEFAAAAGAGVGLEEQPAAVPVQALGVGLVAQRHAALIVHPYLPI
jgi:hypothetical protein